MAFIPEISLSDTFVEFSPGDSITTHQVCDIVTTVAASVLLAVAVSLSIYYAVHPTAPMVPITADFSISLPLLICSGIGIALSIVVAIQMIRCKAVKIAFGRGLVETVRAAPFVQKRITEGFYIRSRPEEQTPAEYLVANHEEIARMDSIFDTRVQMPTRDGVNLSGYYYESDPAYPLVIYFHTTFTTLEEHSFEHWGIFYERHGCNVLLVEYRGYGLSEGRAGGRNQEMEAYLDAEAAWVWARNRGFGRDAIIVHGFEKGCLYAAALGYFFNVQHVILANPYKSYADFMARFTLLDRETTHETLLASFAQGSLRRHPDYPQALALVTDGCDVVNKVRRMAGALFVIQNADDWLTPEHVGKEITQLKYPDDPETQEKYLAVVKGGRRDRQFFFDPRAYHQLLTFLYDRGFYATPPEYTGLSYVETFETGEKDVR